MIATMAPFGHISHATVTLRPDGRVEIGVGTSEFGNGTTTVHTQIVATDLGTTPDRIRLHHSDTDAARHNGSPCAYFVQLRIAGLGGGSYRGNSAAIS